MLNKTVRTILLAGFILLLLSVNTVPGSADVAPDPQPPGSNISPDKQTHVRMLEEHVYMDLDPGDLHPSGSDSVDSAFVAHVKADFSMMNLSTTSELINVRFPLSYIYLDEFLLIKDFQVWVEGKPVVFEKKEYPNDEFQGNMKLWAEFPVTFLPNQEISIRVQYSLNSLNDYYSGNTISYIFETGAGWYKTIGKAELVVNLPYGNSQDSILSISPNGQTFGKTIRWVWQEFEPTSADNFHITLVSPLLWKQVVEAKQAVQDNPEDGSAYTKLGSLYTKIATGKVDINYPSYEELAIEALKKGAELNSGDPEPHRQLLQLYLTDVWLAIFNDMQMSYETCYPIIYEINQIIKRTDDYNDKYPSLDFYIQTYNDLKCTNKPPLTDLRNVYPPSTPTLVLTPTIDPYITTETYTPTSKPTITATLPSTLVQKPTLTLPPSKNPTDTPSSLEHSFLTPLQKFSNTYLTFQNGLIFFIQGVFGGLFRALFFWRK